MTKILIQYYFIMNLNKYIKLGKLSLHQVLLLDKRCFNSPLLIYQKHYSSTKQQLCQKKIKLKQNKQT